MVFDPAHPVEPRVGAAAFALGAAAGPQLSTRGAACFIFYLCYGRSIVMNAMNTAFRQLSTRYEIAGVFARILRIPGTLACPGCNR